MIKSMTEVTDSYDNLRNKIWSTVSINGKGGSEAKKPPKCSAKDQISAATTGIGAAANMLAFIGASGPVGIFASFVVGGISWFGAATNKGCIKPEKLFE